MGNKEKIIISVEPKGLGARAGLRPGDIIISINGKPVADVFDYRYLICDAFLKLDVEDQTGERRIVEIEKEEQEDLGLEFADPLMAKDTSCCNNCIFCFIDQMPKGMRNTLYFKDDDMRLSFLTGNYVTLTNCPQSELERMARYHVSPINVSVHTLNPELRVKMLRHKNAGDIEEKIRFLLSKNITVNAQIVLVPGVNDGAELSLTLNRMLELPGHFESCSIVPVGLTKFREGLTELRTFTPAEALSTIKLIEDFQQMALIKRGSRLFYASDEFYLKAGIPLPDFTEYDEFPQLENGVGMIRLLENEVDDYISKLSKSFRFKIQRFCKTLFPKKNRTEITIATGALAAPVLKEIALKIGQKLGTGHEIINVCEIKNNFFGDTVTVAGLITGRDLSEQLNGKKIGDRLLLTTNMMKADGDRFLDDMTLEELEQKLGTKIVRVGKSGEDLVRAVLYGK